MFKKILLVLGFSLLTSSAFAACTNPLPILNGSSGTVNMSVSQNTADAGCMYNVTPNQGGAPLSATNGWWTNILQGNVALSATNGLYANILQGNVANSAANPFFFAPATSSVWPVSVASLPLPSGAAISATQGTTADTPATVPTTATAASEIALLKAIANQLNSPGAISQTTDGTTNGVRMTSQYPSGAAAVQGSTVGTTAATATTLAATSSVTNYVCQISIRANATAAATGNATLSDGTKTYNFTQWTAPAASGLGVVEEIFNPCYPASAVNTAWTLTSAAPGTGGVVSVAISGYQK
jgi:hypothetical protein